MTSLAMVGVGNWGGNWVRTLAKMPGVELRWCCDLNESLLQSIREKHPGVRTTSNFDDLLEDPIVEGVVLATIAPTHFDLARRALQAGKHVMVEKPMTLSTFDAIRLNEIAAKSRRTLMVGHLLEYHSAILRIRSMIDAGELGEVLYLYSQRLNLGKVRTDENAWWSLAPHDISVALRLFGTTPFSIMCRGQNMVQKNIADVVFAAMEFPGGKLAHVHVSWLDPTKTRKLVVVGSRKMVIFDDTLAVNKLAVHDKGFKLHTRPGVKLEVTTSEGACNYPQLDPTEPLFREAGHFVECIRTGRRPISDGESGATVVAVLEYGQRSLYTGAPVAIPDAVVSRPLAA
jgi:predicted dehydrogenase